MPHSDDASKVLVLEILGCDEDSCSSLIRYLYIFLFGGRRRGRNDVSIYVVQSIKMPKVTVCVRFRPLSAKERGGTGRGICVNKIDFESFAIKVFPTSRSALVLYTCVLISSSAIFPRGCLQDEKDADVRYCFDRVFYYDSTQADIYDFLAAPIVQGVECYDAIWGSILIDIFLDVFEVFPLKNRCYKWH